jgi:hypothetical protein
MSTTYTPNGQTYHASVTLPADGEAAVVASVNAAGFQYLQDNAAWLFLARKAQANVLNYGADSTGVANSQAAFDSAIAALPATGGTVIIPPGTYLLSAGFASLPSGVSFVGLGLAILKLTANVAFFRWTGTPTNAFVTLANLELDASVTVTTTVIGDGAGAHVLLDNVRIGTSNSGKLSGTLLDLGDADACFHLVDCELVKGIDAGNQINVSTGATCRIVRSKLRALTGQNWLGSFVFWGTSHGGMWDSTIDFSGNGSGIASPTGINIQGDGLAFGGIEFTNSAGANGNDRAWSWTAGKTITIGPCNYHLVAFPFGARFIGGDVLPLAARDSIITWRGQYRYGTSGPISSASFILYDGFDSYVVEDSSSSNPTIYLPTPQPGKTLTVLLVNAYAGGYSGPIYDDDGDTVHAGAAISEGQNQLTTWMVGEVVAGFPKWILVTERTY